MVNKASAPQFDAGPSGAVLNVHRLLPGVDEPSATFTPRSLGEHEHPTLQFSVLLRGSIAAVGWQTGGAKAAGRRVRGGQAYIIPPGQPHDFRLFRPEGMVNFHISREALVALDPARFEARPDVLDELAIVADPVAMGLAEGVHAACQHPDGLTPLYLDAAWTMLAIHLARRASPPPRPQAAGDAGLSPRRLRCALDYMEAHLTDGDLRVSDIASVVGLSPVHFTRLFARATGASPMQFVIGRRLDHACDLLRADTMSVADIALATGFGSHPRFSEAFRRRFGLTPTRARGIRSPDSK